MLLGTIQKVSPAGVLTIWSRDLRTFEFAAKWHERLPGLIGSEVEFEEPAGRTINKLRLTRPDIVHHLPLELASADTGGSPTPGRTDASKPP
jgi:hypothetical protein